MSTYVNKVDRKGRVSVPATFRAVLNDQSFEGIVAFPSLDYDALEATAFDTMEPRWAGRSPTGLARMIERDVHRPTCRGTFLYRSTLYSRRWRRETAPSISTPLSDAAATAWPC